jgi:hypothetical protein
MPTRLANLFRALVSHKDELSWISPPIHARSSLKRSIVESILSALAISVADHASRWCHFQAL